jgi:hypothetical protein
MAKTKKKMKPIAKKKAKPAAKKAAKSIVKKKVVSAVRKKTKNHVKRKVVAKKKIKAPVMAPMPEEVKKEEVLNPVPEHHDTPPPFIDNTKYERQFKNREDVAMNRENQKVKSAMAKRQSMKPIYHGLRGG